LGVSQLHVRGISRASDTSELFVVIRCNREAWRTTTPPFEVAPPVGHPPEAATWVWGSAATAVFGRDAASLLSATTLAVEVWTC
jgi:hypothetical protein